MGPQGPVGPTGMQGAPGDSHWQLSGTATFYPGGNVGIGTTAPAQRLDVSVGGSSPGTTPTLRLGQTATGPLGDNETAGTAIEFFGGDRTWVNVMGGTRGIGGVKKASSLSRRGMPGVRPARWRNGFE
jgi:hypothetical protein